MRDLLTLLLLLKPGDSVSVASPSDSNTTINISLVDTMVIERVTNGRRKVTHTIDITPEDGLRRLNAMARKRGAVDLGAANEFQRTLDNLDLKALKKAVGDLVLARSSKRAPKD
jgi:hypothetical protein